MIFELLTENFGLRTSNLKVSKEQLSLLPEDKRLTSDALDKLEPGDEAIAHQGVAAIRQLKWREKFSQKSL